MYFKYLIALTVVFATRMTGIQNAFATKNSMALIETNTNEDMELIQISSSTERYASFLAKQDEPAAPSVIEFDIHMVSQWWKQQDLFVDADQLNAGVGDKIQVTCPGSIKVHNAWGTMNLEDCHEEKNHLGETVTECTIHNTGGWTTVLSLGMQVAALHEENQGTCRLQAAVAEPEREQEDLLKVDDEEQAEFDAEDEVPESDEEDEVPAVDEENEAKSDDEEDEAKSDEEDEAKSDDEEDEAKSDDEEDEAKSDEKEDEAKSDDKKDEAKSDDEDEAKSDEKEDGAKSDDEEDEAKSDDEESDTTDESEGDAITRAAEWSRNNFKWIEHWSEEGKDHHRRLCEEGNYHQSVFDDIWWNRENRDIAEVQELTDDQIWQVADIVLADDYIPNLFREKLGCGPVDEDVIQIAAEWSRNNFQWIEHWGDDAKDHYRRRCEEGKYRQAVFDDCRWNRDMSDTPEVQGLTDDQIWRVADIVLADDYIPNLFKEKLGCVEPAEDDRVHIAAEWVRFDLSTYMEYWPEGSKDHHRQLAEQGNYKQSIYDHIWWHREHMDTAEVEDLTDEQIWEVVADVLRDDLIPDVFERVLGVRGQEEDPVSAAAEWARWDFSTHMKNWGEEGKNHHRKLAEEGNYKQAVYDHLHWHREHYDTKEVKCLNDHQIWEAVELVLRDDLIPNVFKEALFGDDIEDGEYDNAEHDPIWEAAEWARWDFEAHMKHWGEGGKSHHRRLAEEGNYKQSVFDHCWWHREHMDTPQVQELTDDQFWEVAEVALRDDLIPHVFKEALFGDDEPDYEENDPIWEAAEWARWDFEAHMKYWGEEGKSHHRKLAEQGNYKQSVFDHCWWHREHMDTPQVQELTDADIWEVVEVVLRDDLIPEVFKEALFE